MPSFLRYFEQDDIGLLLHLLQNKLTPVWGDIEVSHLEVWSEIGQLVLDARVQVDQPQILVLEIASRNDERPSPRHE